MVPRGMYTVKEKTIKGEKVWALYKDDALVISDSLVGPVAMAGSNKTLLEDMAKTLNEKEKNGIRNSTRYL